MHKNKNLHSFACFHSWKFGYEVYFAVGMRKIERGPVSESLFRGELDVVMVHSSFDIVI